MFSALRASPISVGSAEGAGGGGGGAGVATGGGLEEKHIEAAHILPGSRKPGVLLVVVGVVLGVAGGTAPIVVAVAPVVSEGASVTVSVIVAG